MTMKGSNSERSRRQKVQQLSRLTAVESGRSRLRQRVLVFAVGVSLSVFALLASASVTWAQEPIKTFETTSSDTAAGGHPDLSASFALASPGAPESAKNVAFNAPTGVFGNPNATTQCSSAEFSLDKCPSNTQAGLITVYANYSGNQEYLLGTAPIFSLETSAEQTALFAFIAPTVDIPIEIPVSVRTATDYGLRFTVSNITQLIPVAGAKLIFWGYPADASHDTQRFPKGSPREPAGCVGIASAGCLAEGTPSSLAVTPLTDNPTVCTGEPLVTSLQVQTYKDPEHLSEADSTYPETAECERETFKPLLEASPTLEQTDSPSGLNLDLRAKLSEGFSVSPSEVKSIIVTFPVGFTINPDAADGQSDCTNAQANFHSERAPECPDSSKIGTFSIGTPALKGRLEGSVFLGEPEPGNQYRLFLTALGFGLNVKLVGAFVPNPETGQLTVKFSELPQAPFEDFQLHLFSGERALMATPINCTIYRVAAHFFPWNETLADLSSEQIFALSSGPKGTSCPGQIRPFDPTLRAGTGNPEAGGFSSFTLKLNREDGDQFLGHLNFTMPPGLTANLHGVTYCPEAAILHSRADPGTR